MEYVKPPEDAPLHCPLCGRELDDDRRRKDGWDCPCGEFIPEALALDSYLGSTERIRPHFESE